MKKTETIEKTLAKPLIQAGVEKQPGAAVRLRPDQVARLAPAGYFKADERGRK